MTEETEHVLYSKILLSALASPEGHSLISVCFLLHDHHELSRHSLSNLLFYNTFPTIAIKGIRFASQASHARILSMLKKYEGDESTAEGLVLRKL